MSDDLDVEVDEFAPIRTRPTPIERLMAHVVETPGPLPTHCWICTYADNTNGYAKININRRPTWAHRWSYEFHIGPIPPGYTIDHLCRRPACVNPQHLEAVTNRENFLRSNHPKAVTHRTGICKNGHSMENPQLRSAGTASCRTCRDITNRARSG